MVAWSTSARLNCSLCSCCSPAPRLRWIVLGDNENRQKHAGKIIPLIVAIGLVNKIGQCRHEHDQKQNAQADRQVQCPPIDVQGTVNSRCGVF